MPTTHPNPASDFAGLPTSSPFRSRRPSKREVAALRMVLKREAELEALNEKSRNVTDIRAQKAMAARILATKNNLQSWLDYIGLGCPHEARAVINP